MAERTYVALDLETTGVDHHRDTIIEIGAVRFRGETILQRFSTLVNPRRSLPLRIQQITGITERDLVDAPFLAEVAPELLAFVDRDVHAIVAHNASFDVRFLQAAGIHFHRPVLDTYELSTMLLPGMSSYSLGELCRGLAIPLGDAHRALADAEAAARLFMHLRQRVHALPRWALTILTECELNGAWPPMQLFRDAQAAARSEPEPADPQAISSFSASSFSLTEQTLPASMDGSLRAIDGSLVADCFAPDGPLAQQMGDRYEMRAGQVQMARLIAAALNRGGHRIVEAGTGTGKSLAYLLPAALWATANDQRVVVATDTITLQEQLLEQEIPRLRTLLSTLDEDGASVRTALLKGRSNYLCTRRLQAWRRGRPLSATEMRLLAKVVVWLPQTTTGDVSELAIHDAEERRLWQQIASDPLTCTEERCGAVRAPLAVLHNHDFYWAARARAQAAHLLVINHALLMADLQGGGRLLPPFDHLIVDEAHRLEHAATEQMTDRTEPGQIVSLLRRLEPSDEMLALLAPNPPWAKQAQRLASQIRRVLPSVASFAESLLQVILLQQDLPESTGFPQRIGVDSVRLQPRWSQIELEWEIISRQVQRIVQAARSLAAALEEARWWRQEPQASVLADLLRGAERLAEMDDNLCRAIYQPVGQRTGVVGWLEIEPERETLAICTAPLHVSDLLERHLFRPRRTVVLTGATLRTDEGFDFIQDRLGCWSAEAAAIDSPFNYQTNALLYLPSDVPMPDRPGYQAAVERAIIEAARAAEGRTLVLFTSYSHLRATADAVRAPLDQAGITVLEHGFSSRARLLREFRSGGRFVLLGTGTFWEGIDLPGEMLSCLLIARLPFAVPSDPLFAARSQAYDSPFHDYTIPDAVLRFRQGFGRLIRRADDRGVVVLLDSRAWQKSYGSAFLDAIPSCTTRHAPLVTMGESIRQWLAAEEGAWDGMAQNQGMEIWLE